MTVGWGLRELDAAIATITTTATVTTRSGQLADITSRKT
jgi:hypothetical protein